MNKSRPKEIQIRKVPRDLAKFLARPDFGSFLCEFSCIDRAIAMQLNTQSVSARALYLMLAGYSSLMGSSMERPQPPHVSPRLLTSGLGASTPLAKSIVVNYSPLKRTSFQTDLGGQFFFFDVSLSTAGRALGSASLTIASTSTI